MSSAKRQNTKIKTNKWNNPSKDINYSGYQYIKNNNDIKKESNSEKKEWPQANTYYKCSSTPTIIESYIRVTDFSIILDKIVHHHIDWYKDQNKTMGKEIVKYKNLFDFVKGSKLYKPDFIEAFKQKYIVKTFSNNKTNIQTNSFFYNCIKTQIYVKNDDNTDWCLHLTKGGSGGFSSAKIDPYGKNPIEAKGLVPRLRIVLKGTSFLKSQGLKFHPFPIGAVKNHQAQILKETIAGKYAVFVNQYEPVDDWFIRVIPYNNFKSMYAGQINKGSHMRSITQGSLKNVYNLVRKQLNESTQFNITNENLKNKKIQLHSYKKQEKDQCPPILFKINEIWEIDGKDFVMFKRTLNNSNNGLSNVFQGSLIAAAKGKNTNTHVGKLLSDSVMRWCTQILNICKNHVELKSKLPSELKNKIGSLMLGGDISAEIQNVINYYSLKHSGTQLNIKIDETQVNNIEKEYIKYNSIVSSFKQVGGGVITNLNENVRTNPILALTNTDTLKKHIKAANTLAMLPYRRRKTISPIISRSRSSTISPKIARRRTMSPRMSRTKSPKNVIQILSNLRHGEKGPANMHTNRTVNKLNNTNNPKKRQRSAQ